MPADPALSLTAQLFWAVDCFCKMMAPEACRRRMGALSFAIYTRVRGFERRFSSLYAMWKAGTLPKARNAGAAAYPSPHPSPTRGEGEKATDGAFDPMACDAATLDRARLRPASVLPRALGWLHKLLPISAPPLTGGVQSLLWNYQEMKEFAAACPEVRRILRAMCKMVGLQPPEWLALPKRGREPGLRRHPAASSRLRDDAGDRIVPRRRLPPREQAEDAIRRSEASGKPIALEKFRPAAFGYWAHPPRDGNCPPPEIGYGGRLRPLPRDYKPPRDWE